MKEFKSQLLPYGIPASLGNLASRRGWGEGGGGGLGPRGWDRGFGPRALVVMGGQTKGSRSEILRDYGFDGRFDLGGINLGGAGGSHDLGDLDDLRGSDLGDLGI